jgi:adenosylhomocysteine nucleosidase
MITGIIVALPEELTTLKAVTQHRWQAPRKGGCVLVSESLIIAYAGAGADNARAAAELLIAQGATRLISWGCAAALDSSLKSGDLVLAARLIDADGVIYLTDNAWRESCEHALAAFDTAFKVYGEALVESKTLVASCQDKQDLQQRSGAIAVDMESCAMARVATAHGLVFLVVRTIADTADMVLPRAVVHSFNAQGDVVLWKLLGFLLRQPSELPELIKLGRSFSAAQRSLVFLAAQLHQVLFGNEEKT